MEDPRIRRGLMLYQQDRHEMAIKEFGAFLSENPNEGYALSMMALCLSELERFDEAAEKAEEAIREDPDSDFSHYTMAVIMVARNRFKEALVAIKQAIDLDPNDSRYLGVLAQIHFVESRWKDALEASERGVEIDPEDDTCVNFRAMALTKLGRKKEADETIQEALKRDPENSYSQANLGWQLLEKGEPEKAMLHFQEALRIDPENEWARDGIIHALKARYFIYGLFMKYIFFMARLTSGVQVGIVIGGYFLIRTLLGFARENQEHMIWILPIVITYVAFALLTWTADSVFNLALRMNKYGKLALPPQQVFESNIFASFLFPGLIFIGLWIAGISDRDLLSCALVCGLMLIPLSATFKSNKGWPKKAMAGYTTLMGVIGIIIICSSVFEVEAGRKLIGLFFLFAFVSQFVGNAAMMIRPKR